MTNIADNTWAEFIYTDASFEINEQVAEVSGKIQIHFTVSDGACLQRNAVNVIRGKVSAETQYIAVKFMDTYYYGAINDANFTVYIPVSVVGGPFPLVIYTENAKKTLGVYVGDVFMLAGQSNMAWSMDNLIQQGYSPEEKNSANNHNIRLLPCYLRGDPIGFPCSDLSTDSPLHNDVCWWPGTTEHMARFSAIGWFFGSEIQAKSGVPIGLVLTAVGGTSACYWMSKETAQSLQLEIEGGIYTSQEIQNQPSHGFNSLVYALRYTRFAGVLWYQGENNISKAQTYYQEMTGIIQSYRKIFNRSNMVFVLFELARYGSMAPAHENGWAQINQGLKNVSSNFENVWLAQNFEGDYADIHPMHKKPVALRAANILLNKLYGKEQLLPIPFLKSVNWLSAHRVEIEVENAEGLTLKNGSNGFEIVTPEGAYEAPAVQISNNKIIVTSFCCIAGIRYGCRYIYPADDARRDITKQLTVYNGADLPLGVFSIGRENIV